MIVRIWHGWTTPENADAFESLLVEEQYPEIAEALGDGYLGYELAARTDGELIEYVTITRFRDWGTVEAFAGEDYEEAYLPERERALLEEWNDTVAHYELEHAVDATDGDG